MELRLFIMVKSSTLFSCETEKDREDRKKHEETLGKKHISQESTAFKNGELEDD